MAVTIRKSGNTLQGDIRDIAAVNRSLPLTSDTDTVTAAHVTMSSAIVAPYLITEQGVSISKQTVV